MDEVAKADLPASSVDWRAVLLVELIPKGAVHKRKRFVSSFVGY